MTRSRWILALVLVFACAVVGGWRIHVRHNQRDALQRELHYADLLRTYAAEFPPGTTRQQVQDSLRKRGMKTQSFPAFSGDASQAELVNIDQIPGPMGCGPGSENIAIRFSPAIIGQRYDSPSDAVTRLDLFKLFLDCM